MSFAFVPVLVASTQTVCLNPFFLANSISRFVNLTSVMAESEISGPSPTVVFLIAFSSHSGTHAQQTSKTIA